MWAADGLTAQRNRGDTFPDRKSPGRVTVPGLTALTWPDDFSARLDLYGCVLTESGGGMTATIYTRANRDELVVDVTGADPDSSQTVRGSLWDGRSPSTTVSGAVATLPEICKDEGTGGTGDTLLGITAGGRNVTSSVTDEDTMQVAFRPAADGSFRVDAGATALGGGATTASTTLREAHTAWWHSHWGRAGTLVVLAACDASSTDQQWRWAADRGLLAKRSGSCLDATGPAPPTHPVADLGLRGLR